MIHMEVHSGLGTEASVFQGHVLVMTETSDYNVLSPNLA